MRKAFEQLGVLAAVGVSAVAFSARAWGDEPAPAAPTTKNTNNTLRPYLGIAVEPLHRSMAAHLPQSLNDGRGVVISDVADGSPADKAGLKENDILTGYDDQKLYSPDQLVQLIHHDKSGRLVDLTVVRGGQPQNVKATLGEHQVRRQSRSMVPEYRTRQMLDEDAAQWGSFDSMNLSRIDKDHFRAEIKFRDDKGELQTQSFQGTRDELRRDILNDKHMPSPERTHLLRSLDMAGNSRQFGGFPGLGFMPDDFFWDYDE